MKKLNEKKGFTLAELLIVVAIIAVLVAVAIPVFTAQLNKAKLATATANARSTYAEYVASELGNGSTPTLAGLGTALGSMTSADKQGCTISSGANKITVTLGSDSNEIATDINS